MAQNLTVMSAIMRSDNPFGVRRSDMGQMGMGSAQGYGLMGLTLSDPYYGGLEAPEKLTKRLKFSTNFSYFGLSLWSLQTQKYGSDGVRPICPYPWADPIPI